MLDLYNLSISINEIITMKNSNELKFQIYNTKSKKRYGFVYRYIIGIYLIMKFTFLKKNSKKCNLKTKVAFFSTLNQKKALAPIIDDTFSFVSVSPDIKSDINFKIFNIFSVISYSFYYFYLFFLYVNNIGLNRTVKIYYSCGERIALSILYYKFYCRIIKENNIRVAVVSNDHNSEIRSLAIAAKKFGVKTCYVQHGTVSEHFPNSDIFSMCFFDGKQALDAYKRNTDVCLCGAIRYNFKNRVNKYFNNQYLNINIALNDTIENKDIIELFLQVKEKFSRAKSVNVRFHHMQSNKDFVNELCDEFSFNVSDNNIAVEDFLITSPFLVTVSSGIVLDALRIGVIPIVFLNKNADDHFSYLKNQVALPLQSFSFDECDLSDNYKSLSFNARYYDELIGKSEEEYKLVIEHIKSKIDDLCAI